MSIDIHVFNKKSLVEDIKLQFEQETASEIVELMPDFGIVTDDSFILQSSDYWEGYSPWSEFLTLLRCLNKNKDFDDYDFMKKHETHWVYQGVNAQEVYSDRFDKDLPDDPQDE